MSDVIAEIGEYKIEIDYTDMTKLGRPVNIIKITPENKELRKLLENKRLEGSFEIGYSFLDFHTLSINSKGKELSNFLKLAALEYNDKPVKIIKGEQPSETAEVDFSPKKPGVYV